MKWPEGTARAKYDFANILFSGRCNQRCPHCVGLAVRPEYRRDNMSAFPLPGIERLVTIVNAHKIRDVIITGSDGDPQLYPHERELVQFLRGRLHPGARLSLHTNGLLAVQSIEIFNLYDRAAISFPSFHPETYRRMTGGSVMPDIAEIKKLAKIPVKISCVVGEPNAPEIYGFMDRLVEIGIQRLVFRKQFGTDIDLIDLSGLPVAGTYRNNPVYSYKGLAVAYWDFARATSSSVNLFGDGTISSSYLLAKASKDNVL